MLTSVLSSHLHTGPRSPGSARPRPSSPKHARELRRARRARGVSCAGHVRGACPRGVADTAGDAAMVLIRRASLVLELELSAAPGSSIPGGGRDQVGSLLQGQSPKSWPLMARSRHHPLRPPRSRNTSQARADPIATSVAASIPRLTRRPAAPAPGFRTIRSDSVFTSLPYHCGGASPLSGQPLIVTPLDPPKSCRTGLRRTQNVQ